MAQHPGLVVRFFVPPRLAFRFLFPAAAEDEEEEEEGLNLLLEFSCSSLLSPLRLDELLDPPVVGLEQEDKGKAGLSSDLSAALSALSLESLQSSMQAAVTAAIGSELGNKIGGALSKSLSMFACCSSRTTTAKMTMALLRSSRASGMTDDFRVVNTRESRTCKA